MGETDHQTHVGTPTSTGIGGDEGGMKRVEKEEAQMTKDGRRRWNTLWPQAAATHPSTPTFRLLPVPESLTGTPHERSSGAGKKKNIKKNQIKNDNSKLMKAIKK